MDREGVGKVCLALPGATLDHPFGDDHDAYRIGGKMFVMVGATGGVSFKVSDLAYEVLVTVYAAYLSAQTGARVDLGSLLPPRA